MAPWVALADRLAGSILRSGFPWGPSSAQQNRGALKKLNIPRPRPRREHRPLPSNLLAVHSTGVCPVRRPAAHPTASAPIASRIPPPRHATGSPGNADPIAAFLAASAPPREPTRRGLAFFTDLALATVLGGRRGVRRAAPSEGATISRTVPGARSGSTSGIDRQLIVSHLGALDLVAG
ncbi:hypothetical protein PAHAL_9G050800 [Panicum hallii]|uniref:Uncharacterized protein n=1 Tax=Panicum hallii TaxID=206008 RepID=A0A2T8I078_9POAL|nr:hypothetical protein PAHAL_9G050800 [Panicum hallii]